MSGQIVNYRETLANAMLDEGVVSIARSAGGKLTFRYCEEIVGKPDSALFALATIGYAIALRASGLVPTPKGKLPQLLAAPSVKQIARGVIREAYRTDLAHTMQPDEVTMPLPLQVDSEAGILLEASLDHDSLDTVDAACQQAKILGVVALLDMQQGVRTDLRLSVGVNVVHSVITRQDILRQAWRREEGRGFTDREYVQLLDSLDPLEIASYTTG